MEVQSLDGYPFGYLVDLAVDGHLPLLQILLSQTGQHPGPCVVFDFKAVLVVAGQPQFLIGALEWFNLGISQVNKVEVLLLLSLDVLLVVEELLPQQDKLPLLEGVVVQRLLVQISLSFVRTYRQGDEKAKKTTTYDSSK